MSKSRVKNTKRILSSGIINLVLNKIFVFINRTFVIRFLGAEFAGLSGLFGSVLQVLSLAEFGFSLVIVYYLYEPLAKNDFEKVNQVLSWLRKIYFFVGCVILGGGVLITPFLPYLIHGSHPNEINIFILFLIFLFDAGVSYLLFAYKEALLIADQKKDVINNIRSVVTVVISFIQLIVLVIFRNYYYYALLMVLGTVSSNLLINHAVRVRYPLLKRSKEIAPIPNSAKKELVGLFINRLSNISRNAFDNIIISSTLGLISTTMYGNYFMIYSAAMGITGLICGSIQAGVGNSIVEKSEEENYENLQDFSFLYSWITGWCAVTMACLYQPFMEIWVGKELMLSNTDMILFVVYFYLINMNNIRNQYINGNAFWWKLKGVYLIEAIGNLLLNILLGRWLGVTGILIATISTIFICNYLMCNSVLFKNYFMNESIFDYYRQQFYYLTVSIFVTTITYLVCLKYDHIIIKAIICMILPNGLFVILFRPCSRWRSSIRIVKKLLK